MGVSAKEFHLLRIPEAGDENVGACLNGEVMGVHRRRDLLHWHQWLPDIFIGLQVEGCKQSKPSAAAAVSRRLHQFYRPKFEPELDRGVTP